MVGHHGALHLELFTPQRLCRDWVELLTRCMLGLHELPSATAKRIRMDIRKAKMDIGCVGYVHFDQAKIGVNWERENDIGMEDGNGRVNGLGLVGFGW